MFETLQKISLKKSLFFSAVLLIAGAVLCVLNAQNAFYSATGYVDFTTLAPDEIKSQLVDVDLWENFGCFMESGSKNTSTQRVTISNYYYVIYTGAADDTESPYKYMSIKVPASYGDRMENMTDNTYNGIITSPIAFSGKIRKLDSKEKQYFIDYLREAGFTYEDIDEMTLPCYIDVTEFKLGQCLLYMALFLGGVIMIIWAVLRTVKAAKGGYLKQFRQDIASAGSSEYTVEYDFNAAAPIEKHKNIKMGRLFTYYNLYTTTPRAIPNTKIAWVYQSTTTHRTNGIKTGTTYSVSILTDSSKSAINIPVNNAATAQLIINRLLAFCPWIIGGYSDELHKMFSKDRTGFLNLRFNTVEHDTVPPVESDNSES